MKASDAQQELRKFADHRKSKFFPRFFKTGKGEYGEGDRFIGVTVPKQRLIANKFRDLRLSEIQKLLASKTHEDRLTGLFILVDQFKKFDGKSQEQIYNFYLSNTKFANNWDLVDSSASYIVGKYLYDNPNLNTVFNGSSFKGTKILDHFAKSENLWERRIAMIAAGEFIKHDKYEVTLKIAKILLTDTHDLIHKAVGWMLREVGKRNQKVLEEFLKENYSKLPRTTLRYAIERFSPQSRKSYLKGISISRSKITS